VANYVLAYKGGGMAETEEARAQVMAAWGDWFGRLGPAVIDGGSPFGPSKSIAADGSDTDGGSSGLTGYSILSAESLDAACEHAKGCPVLTAGGTVEVYEALPMM
jgi:hypothetical protein